MPISRRQVLLSILSSTVAACGGGGGADPVPVPPPTVPPSPPAVGAPVWSGHGGNAQHSARAAVATQTLSRLLWSTPVDLVPPYTSGGALLIHYGSPVITGAGTVLLPVKTTSSGNFRVEARLGTSGGLVWQLTSDYLLPASSWLPSCNLALAANNRLYMPAAGGRLLVREQADSNAGSSRFQAFYGDNSVYTANAAVLDAQVAINTPLVVDSAGNVFFGFIAGANPLGLVSGIVRMTPDGSAIWRGVAFLAGDGSITKPAMNCGPALSLDEGTLYVAVNGSTTTAYLLALDSTTLATKAARPLINPRTGQAALVSDSSSASPTVGPDGDVYYGVLDPSSAAHNSRGWLLHFDATLATVKTPGSFGWDDTPSIVPASMVPAYSGTSSYLLLCKYNNYYSSGTGDGLNRMAILDPQATQADPIVPSITVMKEVQTVLGPTADPGTNGGRREWCVNTAAVDPATSSVLVNNEDGKLYRWHLPSNALSESVTMNSGVGQAYTATVVGPTGIVYAVNNAQLHAVGA